MIKPMLAVPMSKGKIVDWNDWAIEEKFDGHRLIVKVDDDGVRAWTRPRKHAGSDGKTMAERTLPPHLVAEFMKLGSIVVDGELLGGDTSTDVTRTDLQSSLRFVVFDVVQVRGEGVTMHSYDSRRRFLEVIFTAALVRSLKHLTLAETCAVSCEQDVVTFVDVIWKRGGEGAILKRRAATYQPGRSPDFIKVKKLQTTVTKVISFEPTRGKVLTHRGLFGSVNVKDAKGNKTSVKVNPDAQIVEFENAWKETVAMFKRRGITLDTTIENINKHHPSLGRELRIEYQDWTPKGGYRHPRWDRWEDE